MENMNDNDDIIVIPKCFQNCPYDVERENRPFCWCRYYIEHFDDE